MSIKTYSRVNAINHELKTLHPVLHKAAFSPHFHLQADIIKKQ